MFLHLLKEREQEEFMAIAQLICLSDNPLLWDGKTEDELTGESDLSKVKFQEVVAEEEILKGFARECGKESYRSWLGARTSAFDSIARQTEKRTKVELALLDKIKTVPVFKQNAPEERLKAASVVLSELTKEVDNTSPFEVIKGSKDVSPSVHKIMLFELFALCLADGAISNVEMLLLKEFCRIYSIDDDLFADLLERAEASNHAIVKTMSIIFE